MPTAEPAPSVYEAQRRWLQDARMTTSLTEAFGGLSGQVWLQFRSALYRRMLLSLTPTELRFGAGQSVERANVRSVTADLVAFELILAVEKDGGGGGESSSLRFRCLTHESLQMWMKALPPSAFKNAGSPFAATKPEELWRRRASDAPPPPRAPAHHRLEARSTPQPVVRPSDATARPPPGLPPDHRHTGAGGGAAVVATLALRVAPGGKVRAALAARDVGAAVNLDTGERLAPEALDDAYRAAPRDAFLFCARRASREAEVSLADLDAAAFTVRNLDTGEAVSGRELESCYSLAPASAWDWAARARSGGAAAVATVGTTSASSGSSLTSQRLRVQPT